MKGIAIGGRMATGKDFLCRILCDSMPNRAVQVRIASAVEDYAIKQGLIPDGIINKARDRKTLQEIKPPRYGEWQRVTASKCHALVAEGMVPIISDIRTAEDEVMRDHLGANLGYPMILMTCKRETQIRRLTERDGISRAEAESNLDHAKTEAYCDKLYHDFHFYNEDAQTFKNIARLISFLDSVR